MIVKKLVIAAALSLCAMGAYAAHCPMDMKQIDAALAEDPSLSEKELAEVKKLRAEGEQLHKAGKHQESVAALGKAKSILGI